MTNAARSFVAIAQEEWSAARRLAATHPRQAAFFIQQTAEKLIKALLTAEHVAFTYHHNLERLAGLLPDSNELKVYFIPFVGYSAWATSHRYPSSSGEAPAPIPEVDDLLQALEQLGALIEVVDAWLNKRPPHIPR